MPGARARALKKARNLPADALILDLEDAVSPTEKDAGRDLVAAAVRDGGFGGRELVIRINGLDTEWGEADLGMAIDVAPDAILLPKVESPELIQDIAARLEAANRGETDIWAMMETPLAPLRAAEIAAASPRLRCLVMGTNDLVNDLFATHTPGREPIITALGLCLLAARAHGLICLDGVYNAFHDTEGLRTACEQGRDFGFDGKTLIHPKQIETTNEIFAPSPASLDLAQRYMDAYAETTAAGGGVAVVDGKIVENLHVANAERLLLKAKAIAALEAQSGST